MGSVGAPYDIQMVEDAANVLPKYKAAIFASPMPSEAGKKAIELCQKNHIPYLVANLDHLVLTSDEIRKFLADAGVHTYIESGDVIYVGNGYVGIHAATAGQKTICLPQKCRISTIFGSNVHEDSTDSISFGLAQYETALFRISDPKK